MTSGLPTSRLARGFGPLGLIGSVLLHGVVLAALVHVSGLRPSPAVLVPPALTVSLLTAAPPEASTAEPAPEEMPTPAVSEPPAPEPPRAALPAPIVVPPARPKPAPRPARPATSVAQATVAVAAPDASPLPATTGAPLEIATAPPPPTEPVRISTTRFRDRRPPTYPAQALRDEIEGVVRLKLLVSPAGRVLEATVLKSSGHRPLDQAAMTIATTWTLYPAEKDGQPVPGWAEVEVPFQLVD